MLTSNQIADIICLMVKAGDEINKYYKNDGLQISQKADDSPVTSADLASDRIIKTGLDNITPGINVYSEETMEVSYTERYAWNPLWILDPLDGTKEFIKGIDEFCISLALVSENLPVAGFIHAPVSGETWYSVKGEGAFKMIAGQKTCLPLLVSGGPVNIAVSRSHLVENEEIWISNFSREFITIKKPAGSAIKFCRIAEGVFDIYPKFGRINEWDVAAGDIIVKEAGGIMLETATGKHPFYNKEDQIQPPFIVFGKRIKDPLKYLKMG
jgi:3'(2'), 5'-bisphosphate nucleotidase